MGSEQWGEGCGHCQQSSCRRAVHGCKAHRECAAANTGAGPASFMAKHTPPTLSSYCLRALSLEPPLEGEQPTEHGPRAPEPQGPPHADPGPQPAARRPPLPRQAGAAAAAAAAATAGAHGQQAEERQRREAFLRQRQAAAPAPAGRMLTAGSAARPPPQPRQLQAVPAAPAEPEEGAVESQQQQEEDLGEVDMAEGGCVVPGSRSREVHLGSTGGDSEGSVSQPVPHNGQPSQCGSPSQQECAAMPPPPPRRQAQHPPGKQVLKPQDEAIEVGGRWAQKAVRGEWEGIRKKEHLKAPVHLATPVAAELPAAASAAPARPAPHGWDARAAGGPAAAAAAAAAAAGTGVVVASAAWPHARPAAAPHAQQEQRQQWRPPPQQQQRHQQRHQLGGIAEEPGQLLEDEEVEQYEGEAEPGGYSSEYGMDEDEEWPPPPAAQPPAGPAQHRAAAHRAAAPHAAAGSRKRHRHKHHGHQEHDRQLALVPAPRQAAKRQRVGQQGGGGQHAWPYGAERRGRGDQRYEPWSEQESENSEVDDSGYSR